MLPNFSLHTRHERNRLILHKRLCAYHESHTPARLAAALSLRENR